MNLAYNRIGETCISQEHAPAGDTFIFIVKSDIQKRGRREIERSKQGQA